MNCEVVGLPTPCGRADQPLTPSRDRLVEVRERLAELRALGREPGERELSRRSPSARQAKMRDACVVGDCSRSMRPASSARLHELGHGALRELKPLGELGDGRLLASVGAPLIISSSR